MSSEKGLSRERAQAEETQACTAQARTAENQARAAEAQARTAQAPAAQTQTRTAQSQAAQAQARTAQAKATRAAQALAQEPELERELELDQGRTAYEGDPLAPICEDQTDEEGRIADEVSERRTEGYGKLSFFLMLNLGLILTAVTMVLFKTPNHLAFGGTTGVAIVLGALFPQLPVSTFMWILNVALVILGFVFLDRKAMIWSSFASIALSAYVSLFEWIFPVTQSITGDLTLDVCFAVLLPAVGSALVFDIGASTGGTDILAMILRKRTDVEIGKALFVVDIAIVCSAAVIYGPRVGLWCILGLVAKTFVVDSAIESIRQRKVCQVICKYPHDVEEFIVRTLGRTATVMTGWGAYTGKRVIILNSVLTRREAMELRLFVRSVDPGAFITITSSSEIIGRGFRGVN